MPSAPTNIAAGPVSDDPNQPQRSDTGRTPGMPAPVQLPAGTVGGNAYAGAPAGGYGAPAAAHSSKDSPFVSFNDYLNANAGALQTERGSSLAAGQASLDKLGADVKPMQDAAYQQGQAAGQAAWSAQRAAGNAQGGTKVTSSEQYKAPDFSVNFSGLPGQEQYAKDSAKAQSDIAAIGQGGLGMGKSAFEAGMIGADQSYKQGAAGLQKQYQDSVNSYLDSIKASGAAGVASFKPQAIVTERREYDPTTSGPGAPREGPVMKPQTRTRKYINGKPVAGEEP